MKENFDQLKAEYDLLRVALERIDGMQVPEIDPGSGDIGMDSEAKQFCARKTFPQCHRSLAEGLRGQIGES